MLGHIPLAAAPLASGSTTAISASLYMWAGTYTLTGNDVGLAVGRKVTASVGAYTLSGQALEFIVSISQESLYRTLLVGSGALRISGYKMITNFTMTAGDYKTLVVTIKDAEGAAVNISGATILWQAGRSFGKASTISKSTSSGISITDGANGQYTVTLDASDTDSMSGTYYHESEMTLNGVKTTVLTGTMKVHPALIEAT